MLLLIILFYYVFVPKKYSISETPKRLGTKYWQLPTGSRIAYTYLALKKTDKNIPIIYLHGGPGGHISDRIIKVFKGLQNEGHDVYFYDQIGSGLSGRLEQIEDYTVRRHINDLSSIIQMIGAKKVILIGQSWGAVLATNFATLYPDKIAKLILTSPGPIFPINSTVINKKAPDSLQLRPPFYSNKEGNDKVANLRTTFMGYLARNFHLKLSDDKEADDFADVLNAALNRSTVCDTAKIVQQASRNGYYASVMTFEDLLTYPDQRKKIKDLTIPVLIMKGQCDNQPWGITNEYLELFQNHQFVFINGAGHFIEIEQPVLYINAIRDFLQTE